jgi:Na+/melibiose symporter-like transporter
VAEKAQKPALLMPLLNKMLFASDHVGLQAISYFRQSWILFFLVPPVGEGLAMVPDISLLGFDIDARVFAGFLIFAGRFVDAFTDPLIGWWSDRTRSCWGRRIPFILFSTPFYALFAALVWILPSEDASLWNALYVVIVLELFFTAATMSSGALEALVPEITHGASDRMNLVGLIFLFDIWSRAWSCRERCSGRCLRIPGGWHSTGRSRAGLPKYFVVRGMEVCTAGHHASKG